MNGLLILDKARGPTSSDVVQALRRLLAVDKVGHTGTLDPMATGVLPICFGHATALAQVLTGQFKRYRATLRLGSRTDSGDADGAVLETALVPRFTAAEAAAAVAELAGPQLQTPPMVSAVKVGGRRLYELARAGQEVVREPRAIEVRTAVLDAFADGELTFSVDCSKGTYVRVLGEDLARRLGTLGHLTALQRTASGRFELSAAVSLQTLTAASAEARKDLLLKHFLPMSTAVAELPQLVCDEAEVRGLAYGQKPRRVFPGPEGMVALLDGRGEVLALATRGPSGVLALNRVFVAPPAR